MSWCRASHPKNDSSKKRSVIKRPNGRVVKVELIKKKYYIRWLMVIGYLVFLVILGQQYVHRAYFNIFFIIVIFLTATLVILLWFLRDKDGKNLTNKD